MVVRQLDAALVRRDLFQRREDGLLDLLLEGMKRRRDLCREMPQRIVTAERHKMDALAHVGHERKMIGPGAIDVVKRDGSFGLEDGLLAGGIDQRAARGR